MATSLCKHTILVCCGNRGDCKRLLARDFGSYGHGTGGRDQELTVDDVIMAGPEHIGRNEQEGTKGTKS